MSYIRSKKRKIKSGKEYTFYYLVESKRDGDKISQKVLKYLGKNKPNKKELEVLKKQVKLEQLSEKGKAPTEKKTKKVVGTTKGKPVKEIRGFNVTDMNKQIKDNFKQLEEIGNTDMTEEIKIQLNEAKELLLEKDVENAWELITNTSNLLFVEKAKKEIASKKPKKDVGTTKIFSVNDELLWRSPFSDEISKVSFRGTGSPGKAMIFTGTTQFEVDLKDLDHIKTKAELEKSIDKIGKEQMKLRKQINQAEAQSDTSRSADLSYEYGKLNGEKENLIFILANQKELGITKGKSKIKELGTTKLNKKEIQERTNKYEDTYISENGITIEGGLLKWYQNQFGSDSKEYKKIKSNYDLLKSGKDIYKTDISEIIIGGVGGKIAKLQSREAKIDHYTRLVKSYKMMPSEKEKDQIIKLEKELKFSDSFFDKKKTTSKKKIEDRPKSKYANVNELDYKLAFEGFRNTSHYPDDRAISTQNEYVRAIDSFAVELMSVVESKDQEDQAIKEIQNYKKTYLSKENELLVARSRIASPMITGGANFPTKRNQKANAREMKLTNEFLDWNDKFKKSSRKRVINSFEGNLSQRELNIMKNEVDKVITWQKGIENNDPQYRGFDRRLGKDGLQGRLLRNLKNNNIELVEKSLEYVKQREKELKKPIFTTRNKVFKELELAKTRPKEAKKTGIKTVKKYKGAKIVNNFDASRIQLEFDEIPNQTIRDSLKSNGWRFSRQNEVWQRKNTSNAIFDSKNVLDRYFDE